ncbi:hypothetical protein [Botrimarina mediterranea]|uniref:Uncharacterized protein n=1 Tax=Botrimarina mediterranea TaxID=2528022 RepID=A0A518K5Q6_9BACT|nr:hypothetical protein [Botrimarina mediterranea]QDV73130.1 hypothetical protein Spa11_13220 [Botrimarina mediterranea]
MQASRTYRSADRNRRTGLSRFEIITCLIAVVGGVWIGAQYYNVDLNGAAYQALDESQLLEKLPPDWRPPNPDCPNGDCPDPAEVRAVEQARLTAKLKELQFEVARLSSGEPGAAESEKSSSLTESDVAMRDRTQAYWQGLTRIVFEVSALQNVVASYAGTEQQSRALAVRRRSLEYGHEATNLLDIDGVDPEAVATGVRVSEWFAQSAEQLKTAQELKTRQPVGNRSVSAADVWAQTEAELQKRTELVRRKSHETSAYLTSKYFAEFPPLGF